MAMTPSDLTTYNSKDWYITNKLDGERFILYSDKLLNRKGEIIKTDIVELPKNEVYDVEKVGNKLYVIDYLTDLQSRFMDRIKKGKKVAKEHKLNLYFKHFLPATSNNLIKLQKEFEKFDSEFEGYILVKKTDTVKIGTTNSIIKWKPLNLNTVDFLYKRGSIYILGEKGLIKIGDLNNNIAIKENSIIEMKPYLQGSLIKWEFMRYREDKNKPNFVTTYKSTVKNIINFKDINFYLK